MLSQLGGVGADYAIVLGSGLMDFAKNLQQSVSIKYENVPHMPGTTVSGHDGKIICGELPTKGGKNIRILCFAGRVHTYEGWRAGEVNFINRLAKLCGAKVMILTNSAGGSLKGRQRLTQTHTDRHTYSEDSSVRETKQTDRKQTDILARVDRREVNIKNFILSTIHCH